MSPRCCGTISTSRRGSAFRWRCSRSPLIALVIAYPCFRFRIIGHYFALVTLALSAIVLQVITATRDITGGSLGYTPERYNGGSSIYALQFTDKTDLVPDRARRLGGGAVHPLPRRSQHAALRAGGDRRG